MEWRGVIEPVSGVCFHWLSLAVRYFFPDNAHNYDRRGPNILGSDKLQECVLQTGSTVEDLYLPNIYNPVSKEYLTIADRDTMYCYEFSELVQSPLVKCLQQKPIRPGYCSLQLMSAENVLSTSSPHAHHFYKLGVTSYLKNEILRKQMENFKRKLEHLNLQGATSTKFRVDPESNDSSPAVTFTCGKAHYDHVPCVFVKWPDDASEWQTRKRKYGWPAPSELKNVVFAGCHLVAKPHPLSECPEIEWRYSFSLAEMTLIKSLNHMQKIAYRVFKVLVKYHEETRGNAIPSYYLKTTYLWVCEQSPVAKWNLTYMVKFFLCLLDTLLGFLTKQELPHYFIPQNNMIEHLSKETIQQWLRAVAYIRTFPLRCMFHFHDKNYVERFCEIYTEDFAMVYRSLDGVASGPSLAVNELESRTHTILIRFSYCYATDCYHEMVVNIAKTKAEKRHFNWMHLECHPIDANSIMERDLKLLKDEYIFFMSYLIQKIYMGKCNSEREEKCTWHSITILSSEVGCICYQLSKTFGFENHRDAKRYFYDFVDCKKRAWNTYVKQAQYLVVQKDYADAFEILHKVGQEKDFYEEHKKNVFVIYSRYTDESVEETLRHVFYMQEEVLFSASALIFYLILICCKELERNPENYGIPFVEDYLKKFNVTKDSRLISDLILYEGCFLLRYVYTQRALYIFSLLPSMDMAAFYMWYCVANIFCDYRYQMLGKNK